MRKFEELEDREKEEIAKSIALNMTLKNDNTITAKISQYFKDTYNSIIEEFSKH